MVNMLALVIGVGILAVIVLGIIGFVNLSIYLENIPCPLWAGPAFAIILMLMLAYCIGASILEYFHIM